MFESIGFDSTMAGVYRTILTRRPETSADIAKLLDVPEADVRIALKRLERLGLLHSENFRSGVQPINPALGLGELLGRQKRKLQRGQEELDRCEAEFAEMVNLYNGTYQGLTWRPPERLVGVEVVRQRIAELARSSTFECLTFNPGGAQSPESLEASRPLDQSVLERGVRMNTVYLDSVRNDVPTKRYAQWLNTMGGEVRTCASLPIRMIIFDREVVITPIEPGDTKMGALQLTDRGVVAALLDLFNRVWESATVLGDWRKLDENGLTEQEKELLRILSRGLTDEAAANQLGLSPRTVRRMVSEIMKRLKAGSRFEAGLRAGQRNWV